MTTALGFGILVGATVVLAWIVEMVLPRRPTGGLKGLIVVGLVSGLFLGWVTEAVGGGPGPSPGGINLAGGLAGSTLSITVLSIIVLIRVFRARSTRQR